MADVKRQAPVDRHQPTKPTRGQHSAGAAGGRREDVAAASAARRAAELVATLSGRRPESVISIERTDGGWRVGVEVVEVARIPDSADILAVYDVRLDGDDGLISYRRLHRYARGYGDGEARR
jgi:hypothetical protein